ncbi:hypothetical protein [Paraburkholderia sacchari]|uniref:Uncharacterized protein n=1 Tax=Paraburkholderia sacchari TaxID=159450 RepID=A0A8T6Z4Z0_9BURK|nr:hypothetical protein [Paraburkholderia sacchari]NLP60297.1 hypothetical protein [Paraburkholderia sacchari]
MASRANPAVIVNACEASPYDVRDNCQLHERFCRDDVAPLKVNTKLALAGV